MTSDAIENYVPIFKKAATIGDLENAWRAISKGRLVRRDVGKLEAGKELSAMVGGKVGPFTIPEASKKLLPKETHNITNKFFIEGQTRPVINRGIKMLGGKKTIKSNKDLNRGLNATANIHEGDEMRQFAKRNNPETSAGELYGHHSISKILGAESNRLATAEDRAVKLGGRGLREFRNKSGEADNYNRLALRDKNGNQPFRYGEGRVNRRYLKELYKKELGYNPRRTKQERVQEALKNRREV